MVDLSKKLVRWLFAALSWFLALGLIVIAVRQPQQAPALLLMAGLFVVNGFLVKPSVG